MSQEPGPRPRFPKRVGGPARPPVIKPNVPEEVLRKYRSNVRLRRPSAPPPRLIPEPFVVTPSEVEQALAAAAQSNTTDLQGGNGTRPVRFAPAVVEALRQVGAGAEALQSLLRRVAKDLGN